MSESQKQKVKRKKVKDAKSQKGKKPNTRSHKEKD